MGGHPEWRAQAKAEIESLLDSANAPPTSSLSSRLSTISLETWEGETPVLDAIIRETLRVAQPHTAMRRNLGPEMYIDGKVIPADAYVVYPFSDVHLDPELYPDPWRFDPGRPAVSDAKSSFSYVGWGGGEAFFMSYFVKFQPDLRPLAGKTICLGQRLGKLELKLITAMFLLGFEHQVVDGTGKPSESLPQPNWNDILFCRPTPGSFGLKYERTGLIL